MRSLPVRVWLITLSVVSLLPLLILSIAFSVSNALESQSTTLARIQDTTRALTRALDGRFESRIALLQGLASAASLRRGDYREFRDRALQSVAGLPAGSAIILADSSGQELVNTSLPADTSLPRRGSGQPVDQVFSTGRPSVTDVFEGALLRRMVVSVDVPVFVDGQVRYDLSLNMTLDELGDFLREQKVSSQWFAALLDRNGMLAARQPAPDRFVGKSSTPALLQAIERQSEGNLETATLEGVDVVSTWSRSQSTGWTVVLAVPREILSAPLSRNLTELLFSGVLAAAFGILLSYALGRSVTRRLVLLERRANALADAQPMPTLPHGIREIDRVDERIRSAAETIRDNKEHQQMLMSELDHRVKNILATVQALVSRTLGRSDAATAIIGRIGALADAHGLLTRTQGRGALLRDILETTLSVHRMDAGRVTIDGPPIALNSKATQALALALHELATNAVKYGALSKPSGHVKVDWEVAGTSADARFALCWAECAGPKVMRPDRRGFGTTLIERNLPSQLNGTVVQEFRPDGLVCRVEAPLEEILSDGHALLQASRPGVTQFDSSRLRGLTVLLVEDEPLAAEEVAELLNNVGCNVEAASRIQQALDILGQHRFDLAVLDVNVHGQRIFPVAHELKARQIPFIFLTGYEDPRVWPEDLRRITRIAKPVKPASLFGALVEVVDRRAEAA